MAGDTVRLPEEQVLACDLSLTRPCTIQPPGHGIQFRRRRKIDHVLDLRHMCHLQTIDDVHSFLHRADRIAVKIGCPLFEFGEVLDRSQASL